MYYEAFDRFRRFLFTAMLYVIFGLGAVFLVAFIILPVVLISRSKEIRIARVRTVNKLAFSSFTKAGKKVGVFDIDFINADRLRAPGQIIISNHPSLLDVVFLLGVVPKANCVVKQKLLKNPFLAIPVFFADYILNDDGVNMLEHCQNSIERGESVIIFPEGTRTSTSGSYSFKRGAAYLMLHCDCSIRPVYISCIPNVLGKKDSWYTIPRKKIRYSVTVLENIDLGALRIQSNIKPPLKSRRLTGHLENWYATMDNTGSFDLEKGFDYSIKPN